MLFSFNLLGFIWFFYYLLLHNVGFDYLLIYSICWLCLMFWLLTNLGFRVLCLMIDAFFIQFWLFVVNSVWCLEFFYQFVCLGHEDWCCFNEFDVIYYILPENAGFGWFIYDLFFLLIVFDVWTFDQFVF